VKAGAAALSLAKGLGGLQLWGALAEEIVVQPEKSPLFFFCKALSQRTAASH